MLKNGIYEQLISRALATALDKAETIERYTIERENIEIAESSKILAQYVAKVVEKGLNTLGDTNDVNKVKAQVEFVNKVIALLAETTADKDFSQLAVDERAQQLWAILEKKNSSQVFSKKMRVIRPETSIAQSSLFTGSDHEPSMFSEFKKEILSCNRIDMLVSFIKWSGLRLIISELRIFAERGGRLRIITTSYMGATDVKAVEELRQLPNSEVKVSYDTKRTRLHAKTYVFYRHSQFTTAYVGSSNLSNVAISSGLEWNVKVTAQDLPDTMKKIAATFESYWHSNDFELYTAAQLNRLTEALNKEKYFESNEQKPYIFNIRPYSYQQEILDKLAAERSIRCNFTNLIVAATGTGKTVIAAFDYKRFELEQNGKPCRLLFVAHREELLRQSLECFRGVLKNANFGQLFVGHYRPNDIDHLFISIQTLNSQNLIDKTTTDFYDYIVIDEFHHAAAPTYQRLLAYYRPKILLGLTATPERMDGKSILSYFGDRIAAEIRLPEAIERKLLCPFHYFGVTDTVDLSGLKWMRGGYDKSALSNIYTMDRGIADKRANYIIASLDRYVTDMREIKGLGFCVSVEHAKYMAQYFNSQGLPSLYLVGDSSDEIRHTAKQKLVQGDVRFIFVVDLYNEGVDIPEVNTVLFLRPTESLTVFLQQLGRGLRLVEGKECLTVLDFIGQANKRYNFADKFKSLLANTERGIQQEVKNGFASVPKGCFIQLEKIASEYVLKNITDSLRGKGVLIERIRNFEDDTGESYSLKNFLAYYKLDPRDCYRKGYTFSRLEVLAGKRADFFEVMESVWEKAFVRVCDIDSQRWIRLLLRVLPLAEGRQLSPVELRLLQMFQFTIWQKSTEDCGFTSLQNGLAKLRNSPVLFAELLDLLQYNYESIDFIDKPVDLGFDCPLDLHCRYSRDQILVAMDFMKPCTVREGVKYLPDKKIDIFFVTLNKSDKEYSPSTLYNDYSINETLFHWQSQSTTGSTSPTGQRYIHHKEQGSQVLLFVRENKKNAPPYTFLGLADYVSCEGSKPMNVVWRLEDPIPSKFMKKTNKLLVV